VEEKPEDVRNVLKRFGWEDTDEFWNLYHTVPWVFNLANALAELNMKNLIE
jgi:hypothetical protein